MFNALNRFISRLDSDPIAQTSNIGGFGFQVLRNTSAELSIEPWFDFIVGINGRVIDDSDSHLFSQEVRNCAGTTVSLGIWSAKGQKTKMLQIPIAPNSPSLGLTLQWTSLAVASNVWHILDVPPYSPADLAGLLPYSDFILGTPEGVLHGESGLGELVEDHVGRPLKLFVYNHEYDVTREVTIYPSRDWGGEGALGCVLGYGVLHRLPAPLSEPLAGPGETLFDTDNARFINDGAELQSTGNETFELATAASGEVEFLVPAQMLVPPAVAAQTQNRKREKKTNASPNKMMDDYFLEGEKKSREQDYVPNVATPPPPPPKAGVPLKAGEASKSPTVTGHDDDGVD